MGSAQVHGALWGQAPEDWAYIIEKQHSPLFEAMLNVADVGQGTHLLDAGCGEGRRECAGSRTRRTSQRA